MPAWAGSVAQRLAAARRRVRPDARLATNEREVIRMAWETPEFTEIRMDAEINSYQDDFSDET
jgi:coenzyme PQQ precursor peptide PqqA